MRGAEHRHRADGALHHPEVRARQRLALGQGLVVAAIEIVAGKDVAGEQAQLPGGAAALGDESRLGQTGFGAADFGDGVGAGLDLVGDGLEKDGALGAACRAIGPERRLGRLGGVGDQGRRADGKRDARTAGRRVLEGVGAADPVTGDQSVGRAEDSSYRVPPSLGIRSAEPVRWIGDSIVNGPVSEKSGRFHSTGCCAVGRTAKPARLLCRAGSSA